MARTRWQTLLLIAAAAAAATWALYDALLRGGALPPQVPWLVVGVEVLIAAVVFSMGWAVRQYIRGKRPGLDPIRAARTAVLAKAACYTGAVLLGWYGGQLIVLVLRLDTPGQGARVLAAALAALGALSLAAVGLVVERFCRVPPPEGTQPADQAVADPPPAAT